MPTEKELFDKEKARLDGYLSGIDTKATASHTELAYRDLNSHYLELQQGALPFEPGVQQKDLSARRSLFKKDYERKKKAIEESWHTNTDVNAGTIMQRGVANTSSKEKAFYANFNAQEMEILIKNSDRGGNSEEYNDVATALELFNSVQHKLAPAEQKRLLDRLKASCEHYLETRKNPFTTKGKIRKAIIGRINDIANEELSLLSTVSYARDEEELGQQETTFSIGIQQSDIAAAATSFRTFEQQPTQQNLEAALRDNFSLLTRHLQGIINLGTADLAELKTRMITIIEEVNRQPVDANQSPTLSTRFFNTLGWTSHLPEIVDPATLDGLIESSSDQAIKVKGYHSISGGDGEDALPKAKQLLGEGRQFMSNGMYGKGTYLAVTTQAGDAIASKHSWHYGQTTGSVQLTIWLNERAKVVQEYELKRMIGQLQKELPELYNAIVGKDVITDGGTGGNYRFVSPVASAYSVFAALFGFNTIKGGMGSSDGRQITSDYYVCFDRSAMTMSDEILQRNNTGDTDDPANITRHYYDHD